MDIIGISSRLPAIIFGENSDDDFSDRLNYRYTVALLILFSVLLTSRLYGSSEVIKCWVPAHFTSNYESYVNQVCWITNTYHIETDTSIPKNPNDRHRQEIRYYQWVAFVLLAQAFFFYIPRIFWTTSSLKCGLNIGDLVTAAHKYKSVEQFNERKTLMKYMVKNIDQYVDDNRRFNDTRQANPFFRVLMTAFPCCGRFLGNYIVVLYFIVKVMYFLNTFLQTLLVGVMLGKSFWKFGLDFFYRLIVTGEGWQISSSVYFPKVTLCDFLIREVGNPNKSHRYTVQCVLPINLFNQQIFTFIWIWYVVVLVWNVFESIKWISRCLPFKSYKWMYQRILQINENVEWKSQRLLHFLRIYLEPDGIFMVRMIANNTSDYVAADLVHALWCQHAEKYDSRFPNDSHCVDSKPCVFEHEKKFKKPDNDNNDDDKGDGGGGGKSNNNKCKCQCDCICKTLKSIILDGDQIIDFKAKHENNESSKKDGLESIGYTTMPSKLISSDSTTPLLQTTKYRKRSDDKDKDRKGGGGTSKYEGPDFVDLSGYSSKV